MDPVLPFALVAICVGAAAQAITGIGFSLVCAPLLTVALNGPDGVRLANFLAVIVNVFILGREWPNVEFGKLGALFVPALITIPAVSLLVAHADAEILTVITGVLVLLAVGALGSGVRIRRLNGRAGAFAAGAASGGMNVTGGVGGPAIASYALNAEWDAKVMRPTLAAFFLGINVLSVATRGVPSMGLSEFAMMLVVLVVGFLGGAWLSSRLDHHVVRRVTLWLAAAGGCAAIIQGIAS